MKRSLILSLLTVLIAGYFQLVCASSIRLGSLGVKIIGQSGDFVRYSFKLEVESIDKDGKICVNMKALDSDGYEVTDTSICGVLHAGNSTVITDARLIRRELAEKIESWVATVPMYTSQTVSVPSPPLQ
ncbi:MAG: hypothetical protein JRI45_11410 [Deltaproteobacteria bacterium]|nr:hypothetical protein [Deltaproteobacteria bacterium]MBW2069509.1 hypothetical protein [Deltaproteobacteria bacterium]